MKSRLNTSDVSLFEFSHFLKTVSHYGGDSLKSKSISYINGIGVTIDSNS